MFRKLFIFNNLKKHWGEENKERGVLDEWTFMD